MWQFGVAFFILASGFDSAQAETLARGAEDLFGQIILAQPPAPPPTPPLLPPVAKPGGTEFREPPGVRPGTPLVPPAVLLPPVRVPQPKPQQPTPPAGGRWPTPSQYSQYTRFPVWDTFYQTFKECEPGCEPRVNNLHRPHSEGSCHQHGFAIDIDGIHCKGEGSFPAYRNARFEKMVRCMQRKSPPIWTLWKNGEGKTEGHHDNAHFSVRCGPGRRRI